MVELRDDTFLPLLVASLVLFVSSFLLGAVMQNWDAALLRPSNPGDANVVLGDSTTMAYLIVGFFHFGGMVSGAALFLGSLVTLPFDEAYAQRIRALLIAGTLPLGFGLTFVLWVFFTLPRFGWVVSPMRFDRALGLWLVVETLMLLFLAVRFAHDVLT